jgi:hypothetical protein
VEHLPALRIVAVVAERPQKLQRRLPGSGRVHDAEMGGVENGVKLALPGKIDRGGTSQQRASGEVVRLAVAVLSRDAGREPVQLRQIDEVAAFWVLP